MSNQALDLSDHGFQDATTLTATAHDVSVNLFDLSLTDMNASTLQFIDGTYTVSQTAATGSFSLDPTATHVAEIYHTTLGRDPDFAGEAYWKGQLTSGQENLQQVADQFVGCPEFTAKYVGLNNTDFVNLLYQNVLGRPGDSGGVDYWVGQLNAGADRGQVVLGFAISPEDATHLSSAGGTSTTVAMGGPSITAAGGIQFTGPAHA